MPRIKLDVKDFYKIVSIVVVLATMVACYLHRVQYGGNWIFQPRIPGKEWWGFASYLLLNSITSKIDTGVPTVVMHTMGIVVTVLIALAGVSEFFNIDVGTQFWTVIGSLLGAYFGLKNNN